MQTVLLLLFQSGSYRSYLVHEDLVVTERIDDIKPLGFYIRRLCDGKETYRMQRRSSLPGMNSLDSSRLIITHLRAHIHSLH